MQTTLLWTGREYYSLENCLITTTQAGATIHSAIVGKYHETIYRVDYVIKTNKNWETIFLDLKSRHNDHAQHLHFEGDGYGNWTHNDDSPEQFKGCIDIDIPLTPFTNTLPIKRLGLRPGDARQIQVLYLDILGNQILPVQQKYVCLSDYEYHYENVPNDFEADIMVDAYGFVVDYPALFERSGIWRSRT